MQTAHAAQYQQNKQPNQKMGGRSKQTFLQRRHTDGQKHMKRCSISLIIREMSIQIFHPFFDWVVCFFDIELHELFALYILEINPLLVVSFASIFSHSVGCLFILFMVSFAVQKLLSLIRSHLFIFVCFHYSRKWIKKDLAAIFVRECSAYVFL